MPITSYHLQYSGVNASQVASSGLDAFITEGAPVSGTPAITDAEVATIQAAGTQVFGYVNVSVTDDARPYWDAAWTSDGTDTGTVLAGAPAWLQSQPTNPFGYIVDYSDADWRQIVIDQAVDLVTRGYDGIFLDDVAQYFVAGAAGGTAVTQAQIMMEFVAEIDAAIQAASPGAQLISNGDPYIVTNAPGGAGSAASVNFLAAIDGMLLESFFGSNDAVGVYQDAAIQQALTQIAPHADVLALEFGGEPSQNHFFYENAAALGIVPTAAVDASYSSFVAPSQGETGGDDSLLGTAGPDTIKATGGVDIIEARQGDDLILAGVGDDSVSGEAGDDTIRGQGGNDELSGGDGDDELTGGVGNDVIFGGTGVDVVLGQPGLDTIDGGAGADTLYGGSGNDSISGGTGSDVLLGQGNNDILDGGIGADMLRGAEGADILFGDSGDDTLRGGNGLDTLAGGEGDDLLNGGAQADRFVFGVGDDADIVGGFEDNIDTIAFDDALWGGGLTVTQVVSTYAEQVGGNVVFDFGNGDTVRLNNFTLSNIEDDVAIF